MPTYEMKCVLCGDVHEEFLMISELESRERGEHDDGSPIYNIDCKSCDSMFATQNFAGSDRNFIHETLSSMYGGHHRGKYHPGLGVRIRDRAHKNAVMKEQGVREAADPIGGSRTVLGDSGTIEQHFDSPGAKARESREQKQRAEERQRQGFHWA
jgi:hypothetical protein